MRELASLRFLPARSLRLSSHLAPSILSGIVSGIISGVPILGVTVNSLAQCGQHTLSPSVDEKVVEPRVDVGR